MISVIILNNGEPNVVQLTFENIYRELKDIPGSELLIKDRWFDIKDVKNRYVCFLEADCLVEPGYFTAQLERFKKKGFSRLTGVMSAATAIGYWDNKIYGYCLGSGVRGILPNREPKSTAAFSVQVAYIPGAVIRMTMLETILANLQPSDLREDLVYLSAELSVAFWEKGYRIYLNPKTTYLTTEGYVNDIGDFGITTSNTVTNLFARESI